MAPGLLVCLFVIALGLALLPLPAIALLVGAGAVVALALIEPVFGLYLAVLSVPVQELAHLPGGLSYTQAAMLLAAGAWALRVLAHPERPIVKGRLFPLWVALLCALLLSASFTPYSGTASLKETLRWAEAFLVWLIAVNTLRRRWQIAGLAACLVLAPAAEAAIGLAQFITGHGPPSFRIAPGYAFVRAYGTIGQPNSFAGYLNMAWPLALALAIGATAALRRPTTDRRPGDRETGRQGDSSGRCDSVLSPRPSVLGTERRTLNDGGQTTPQAPSPKPLVLAGGMWLIAGVLIAALAASFSRGAWLGALLGTLAMLATQGRRALRWSIAAVCAGAVVLALGGAGLLPDVVAARLTSITRNLTFFDAGAVQVTPENFSVVDRMAQIQAGWRMFMAHPLTGVGPGNYTSAYYDFAVLPWYSSRGHAHNYYLHMAAEAGIAGALAFLSLLIGVGYQAIVALRRAKGIFRRSVAVGCCGIIAAVAGHDMFENLHVLSMGIQLAAVWGLLVVISDREAGEGVEG